MSRLDPPAIVEEAPVPRHEAVHQEIRRLVRAVDEHWLQLAELAREVIDAGHHVKYGYASIEEYFLAEFGIPYRSLYRRTSILAGIRAVPEEAQAEVTAQLIEAGVSKAGILATLLRKQPEGWEALVASATTVNDQELQNQVNVAMGRPARPLTAPGERFRRWVISRMPPDQQERVDRVWRALDQDGQGVYRNPVDTFLLLIALAEVELAAKGVEW